VHEATFGVGDSVLPTVFEDWINRNGPGKVEPAELQISP